MAEPDGSQRLRPNELLQPTEPSTTVFRGTLSLRPAPGVVLRCLATYRWLIMVKR